MDQPKRIAGFHFTMSIADNQSSRMWDREQMPAGLEEKQFSGGKYAKVIHKGTTEALLATYGYIWGTWFPESGYRLADRADFERYTEKFLGPLDGRSEIEIYFPIQ